MNHLFRALFIVYSSLLIFSCNTNSPQESRIKTEDSELSSDFIDSLDTDTSRNYIYSNVPAHLHSETDSVFDIIQSIDDSVRLVIKIREKLVEMEFHPTPRGNHFSYLRKRFNRRTYVSIEDTLARNKEVIINSYFWENGKKYNNIIMYFTDPE